MAQPFYDNNNVDIARRLKRYKMENELTYEQLAEELGVDKTTVVRWCQGSFSRLRAGTQKRLYELLNVDLDREADVYFKKPILSHENMGEDVSTITDYVGTVVVDGSEDKLGDYFLKVEGSASEDFNIPPTSLIYVKSKDSVSNGHLAIVRIGETAAIKRYFEKDGIVLLESGNKAIPTRMFSAKEVKELPVQVVGEVVSVRIDFTRLQKRLDAESTESFRIR